MRTQQLTVPVRSSSSTVFESFDLTISETYSPTGTHRVLKRILSGTEITTDYLGQSIPKPTHLRRMDLWRDKRFWCGCELCSSPCDRRRGLSCPQKSCDGTIFPFGHFSTNVLFPNDEETSSSDVIDKISPPPPISSETVVWRCESCHVELENSSSKIFMNKYKNIERFRFETFLESEIRKVSECSDAAQLLEVCTYHRSMVSLKYDEYHRNTHSYHYTLKNYESYYSLMSSNVIKYFEPQVRIFWEQSIGFRSGVFTSIFVPCSRVRNLLLRRSSKPRILSSMNCFVGIKSTVVMKLVCIVFNRV